MFRVAKWPILPSLSNCARRCARSNRAACGDGGGLGHGWHRLRCGHDEPYRTPIRRAGRGVERGRAPGVDQRQLALANASGSSQVLPRHPKAIAYRCFLPDLTGFTDLRCAGPDSQRRTRWWWTNGAALDREFSSAIADCGYRAPLVPRLARPAAMVGQRCGSVNRGGGEGGIRTLDGLPRTAFPVPRHRPLGDLSAVCRWRRGWDSNPRYGYPYTAFRERHLQPLGHLSTPLGSLSHSQAGGEMA